MSAKNEEDHELEEGEIADDSNDGGDECADDFADGQPPPTLGEPGEQGEPETSAPPQKKKKKVVRKIRRKIKVKKKVPKREGAQEVSQLNQPQLDSLLEQQILMLQEMQRQQQLDQQHAQILRAAATDEDLRIFLPPAPIITQSSTLTPQPSANVHQTPSSPDDENGKSSYEAISKMLTMLRNSANISDSSDLNQDFDGPEGGGNNNDNYELDDSKSKDSIEYSLIPILVDGIDYTKYKLLSQYEPKFKNDPRLNQQT